MNYRIVALPVAPFASLFGLNDETLAARGVLRRVADEEPGFPCRVSLQDAEARLEPGVMPQMLRNRTLSIRAFDSVGMLIQAELAQGEELEAMIGELFTDPRAEYLHLHSARAGCYLARVERCDPT